MYQQDHPSYIIPYPTGMDASVDASNIMYEGWSLRDSLVDTYTILVMAVSISTFVCESSWVILISKEY